MDVPQKFLSRRNFLLMKANLRIVRVAVLLALCLGARPGYAGPVGPLTSFNAGATAKASEVNGNFASVKTAVDDNDSRISALQAQNSTLISRIAALEAKLASVSVTTSNGQPTVRFSGVNVQVVNGLGDTATANGTGNLVVGYDEADVSGVSRCSLGTNPNDATQLSAGNCAANGGTVSTSGFKTGSHYLVAGSQNNYSRWGGVVFGFQNTSNFDFANVVGGQQNTASGPMSSVTAGSVNTASGLQASVTGGGSNTASGPLASVSGGAHNAAIKFTSSVSGGQNNAATGQAASVSGGELHTASGIAASVSGGHANAASGDASSVAGGNSNIADGNTASVSGGQHNTASGLVASVSGGQNNEAGAPASTVGGGQGCVVLGLPNSKWIVGQGTTAGCSATLGN
jgi:hypothetical protein